MKASRLLPAILVLAIGCATDKSETNTGTATDGPKKEFKVALLTPGPISDAGWSAMAYAGLKQIEKDLGAQVSHQEVNGTQGIRDAMRSYAQRDHKLVFGHGFEYNEPATQVAKDFPNTVFVSSSGGMTAQNVGAFRFYLEQGFYLAGMLAAKMSQTGVIGSVAGPKVPSIASTLMAYEAGAKAARPDIKVITPVYTGKDSDIVAAKQAALQVIGQGADFLIHQANAGAQGVFDAAEDKGVWALGANLDQNSGKAVIASAVIVAGPAFVDLATKVRDGTYKGDITLMGIDKGAIDFVINPKLADRVPADVKKLIADTKAKIIDGSLKVPMDKF